MRRFSEDLDFTANGKLSEDLPKTISRGLSLYGIENELKIIKNDGYTLSFKIMANGPLNTTLKDRCVVYVEISRRENVLSETLPLKVDFVEYDLPVKRLRGMSLDEVAAEKIMAILTRNKDRDVYDLHHMVEKKDVAFNLHLVNEKLSFYDHTFDNRELISVIKRRESNFKRELKPIILDSLPEYGDVVKSIEVWTLDG